MSNTKITIVICFALFVIFVLPSLYSCQSISIDNFAKTGPLGDTIGGIAAPIIGIINIVLLICTLRKQLDFNKRQIALQREEQFKSTFFQMLGTQRESSNEIKGKFLSRSIESYLEGNIASGAEYFHCAKNELRIIFDVLDRKTPDNESLTINTKERFHITPRKMEDYRVLSDIQKIAMAYNLFYEEHPEIGNYFRHLYHILKFISQEEMLTRKQNVKSQISYKEYADILQATLSFDELCLAYYNCFIFTNAKRKVKEYDFLENLKKRDLINPERDYQADIYIKKINP